MVNGLHLTGTFLDNWKAFTHDTHSGSGAGGYLGLVFTDGRAGDQTRDYLTFNHGCCHLLSDGRSKCTIQWTMTYMNRGDEWIKMDKK